jgi:hypothetical protein
MKRGHYRRAAHFQATVGSNFTLAIIFILGCILTCEPFLGQAIQTNPENPHYFLFRGKPTVLITSAEHYGAVINLAFDYVPYLDALQAHGLNYTRIYSGAMFESTGKNVTGNPLGVKPRDLIMPWARSNQPGYMNGGNKFDLDQWDSAYFARLKDFIAKAAERGIVVEICFFNSQYSDSWPISPLYYENNTQGIGTCDWRDVQSLHCGAVTDRQADYVRKIVQEVNPFDNVILEICDEGASTGTGVKLAGPWVSRLIGVARDAESNLPKKHLLAQEVEGPFGGPMDFSADPRVSIVTAQYLWGREPDETGGEMGGLKALDYKYDLNKPIELNETEWYPIWYKGDKIADVRVESWEFIVGGGAGFNSLNGLFTQDNPAGKSPENDQILGSLQNLKQFIESFDFIRMRQDKTFVVGGLAASGVHYRSLSEIGKQYAVYIHHSSDLIRKSGSVAGAYTVEPGNYQENLVVSLPAGNYEAEWIDPARGVSVDTQTFRHEGGHRTLTTPIYQIDIALRIKKRD